MGWIEYVPLICGYPYTRLSKKNIYYHTTLKFLTSVSSILPKAVFPEYIFKVG